jgi:hypothetical protein
MLGFKFQILPRMEWFQLAIHLEAFMSIQCVKAVVERLKKRDISNNPVPQLLIHFIMFSVITNIYNKETEGPTLMELFTATGKLKKFFFDN